MTIQTSKMFLMTVRKLSAFTPCRNKNNNLGSLNKLRDLQKFAINFTTMGSWKNEKQKYLSMSVEERRKNYKDYVKWEDIPTWKEYATKEQSKLAKKIDIKSDYVINPAQHAELCDKVSIFLGDITTLEIDAIVNAANNTLLGGGGVDGAIHRRAGSFLLEECRTLNGCETGEAKITGGYKLPAKYVIHTVGPRGEKPDYLKNSYNNCLNLLVENKLRSIAFPCISTGIYGYPVEAAAHVSVYTVRKQLEQRSQDIDRVVFCLFSDEDKTVYEGVLQSYFPVN